MCRSSASFCLEGGEVITIRRSEDNVRLQHVYCISFLVYLFCLGTNVLVLSVCLFHVSCFQASS